MELTGEFPPIVRKCGQGEFFDLMTHAFGLAGLGGASKLCVRGARRGPPKRTRSSNQATLNSSSGGTRRLAQWASSRCTGVQDAAQDQGRNVASFWDYIGLKKTDYSRGCPQQYGIPMKQPERGRPRRLGTEADAAEQLKLIADVALERPPRLVDDPRFMVGRFVCRGSCVDAKPTPFVCSQRSKRRASRVGTLACLNTPGGRSTRV